MTPDNATVRNAAGPVAARLASSAGEAGQTQAEPLRLVLCDDHPVVRDGLRLVLSGFEGMEVVGEASGSENLLGVLLEHQPAVLILDLTLDHHDGIPLIREVRTRFPEIAVVVLTMHRDPETVRQALLAGAAGYVPKGARASDLVDAIRAVTRGERYVHSSVAGTVIDDSVRWLRSGSGMSDREREVLALIAGGQSAPMIAAELGISVHTVHRHVANLSAKLNTRGLPALIRFAIERGYVRASAESARRGNIRGGTVPEQPAEGYDSSP